MFAFYFVSHRVICLPASCCAPSSFPILPHMLIALLQSESQTVQGSLSHDCHKFATDSFPLLLPGKHLLVAWQLFTPLLIYKLKYIHSSASTGLKFTAHSTCCYEQLKLKFAEKICDGLDNAHSSGLPLPKVSVAPPTLSIIQNPIWAP